MFCSSQVTPLDEECGLVEWVPNMLPLREVIRKYWDAFKLKLEHTDIKARYTRVQASSDRRCHEVVHESTRGSFESHRMWRGRARRVSHRGRRHLILPA